MKTQAQIQQSFDKLGIKVVSNTKSFASLHQHIQDAEEIIHALDAVGSLAIVTNKRFLCVSASLFSAPDLKDVRLDKITNVKADLGFMTSDLQVFSAGGVMKVSLTKKDGITTLKNKLSEAIDSATKPANDNSSVDVVGQLEKLAELKSKGILTEEEFAEQKKKILAQ